MSLEEAHRSTLLEDVFAVTPSISRLIDEPPWPSTPSAMTRYTGTSRPRSTDIDDAAEG